MKLKYIVLLACIFLVLISCKNKEEVKIDKDVIAAVNGEYLYKKDIVKIMPKFISSEDSVKYVSEYVNHWVADRVIFAEATETLTDTSMIEEKVKQYRQQLYVYYYIDKFVYNDVSYSISEEEIQDYYNKHLQDYVLAKTYVKVHYMTMAADVYTYYQEREKIFNSEPEDIEELKDYCIGTGRKVYFIEEWTELGDFLHEVKLNGKFDANELLFKSTFEHISGELRYLIKYDDYKTIGDYMPLEIAKNDIITIIINNRKRDKLIQKQNELIEKGLNSGAVTLKN